MNIFATSPDPAQCARWLDDARVVNQVRETAQLLSTAARLHGIEAEGLNRATHADHPVTRWTAGDPRAAWWVGRHGLALAAEYSWRYEGRVHASEAVIRLAGELLGRAGLVVEGPPEVFANSARNVELGLDFRHLPVHSAYREYLAARWNLAFARPYDRAKAYRPPRWKCGSPPWYTPTNPRRAA